MKMTKKIASLVLALAVVGTTLGSYINASAANIEYGVVVSITSGDNAITAGSAQDYRSRYKLKSYNPTDENQKFVVKYLGSGQYAFKHLNSSEYLGDSGRVGNSSYNVVGSTYMSGPVTASNMPENLKWKFTKREDGSYSITNLAKGAGLSMNNDVIVTYNSYGSVYDQPAFKINIIQ